MNRTLLLAWCLGTMLQASFAEEPASRPASPLLFRERIEWCDIWFTDAEKEALPRVLLIGDSITRGYFDGVEKNLDGKAYCGRLCTSRSVCDPVFFQELEMVLKQYPYAAIHFNNGLHGKDYTDAQYRDGMTKFLETLRKMAPQAKLICATSTPVKDQAQALAQVEVRNAIVTELSGNAAIPVDDLYVLAKANPDSIGPDGVHFNEAGRALQAQQVGAALRVALGITP